MRMIFQNRPNKNIIPKQRYACSITPELRWKRAQKKMKKTKNFKEKGAGFEPAPFLLDNVSPE